MCHMFHAGLLTNREIKKCEQSMQVKMKIRTVSAL